MVGSCDVGGSGSYREAQKVRDVLGRWKNENENEEENYEETDEENEGEKDEENEEENSKENEKDKVDVYKPNSINTNTKQ